MLCTIVESSKFWHKLKTSYSFEIAFSSTRQDIITKKTFLSFHPASCDLQSIPIELPHVFYSCDIKWRFLALASNEGENENHI